MHKFSERLDLLPVFCFPCEVHFEQQKQIVSQHHQLGRQPKQLAKHLGISTSRLNDVVRRRRGVTGDTALRLAGATNTTPEFWLNLQTLYDLETARDALGDRLEKEVTPVTSVRPL